MKRKIVVPGVLLIVGVVVFLLVSRKTKTEDQPQTRISTEVPVSVTTVRKDRLTSNLTLVGTIAANNDVNVVSQTQGEVKAVYVKVGEFVKAGTVLVQVDDEIKRSNLAAAEINYQKAKRDFERSETLYQENSISAAQLDAARLALKSAENQLDIADRQLQDTRISSPIGGTTNARMVDVGTMVSPGMTIANIVDISTLKVRVNVAEREAFRLKPGAKVEVTTDVYPDRKFDGSVDNIASKADEAHTYPVEIRIANSTIYPLKAGMFARVSFTSVSPTEALVIPRTAVVGSVKDAQVYVIQNDRAYLRSVIVGDRSGEFLEVIDGLKVGDTVVTSGQNNLSDNTPVTIVR
jgi:RND family efflux transporter MFP subunit